MEANAIAKHARAVERLRITHETLEVVLELLDSDGDAPAALARRLVERERSTLADSIADLA